MKTNRTLIVLLFVSLFCLQTNAQEISMTDKVAVISFDSDELDYGKIIQNSDGIKVFNFVNTGNSPLVITDVKTSCGCTVPTYSKESILPGQSGQIEVKYNTKKAGTFTKSITVISNAKGGNKILKIKGIVEAIN